MSQWIYVSVYSRLATTCPCHVRLIWLSTGFVLFVNENRQRSSRERLRVHNFLCPFFRMETRHDSVLRSRYPGIPNIPTFPDLDGTLEGECKRREDQEGGGDRPATSSNGEKSRNPSSAGSEERTRNCCYSAKLEMHYIDLARPLLFYFCDCHGLITLWRDLWVTREVWTNNKLVIVKGATIIFHIYMDKRWLL